MRDIKFRAKRIDTLEWVFGFPVMVNGGWFMLPFGTPMTQNAYYSDLSRYGTMGSGDGPDLVGHNAQENNGQRMCQVIDSSIGQFTGLKDKNGKDIYDGDIDKWYTTNSANLASLSGSYESVHYSVMTWIDEWKMWGWLMIDEYADYLQKGVECLDETLFWTYNAGNEDPIMICGNIHDNPELLA